MKNSNPMHFLFKTLGLMLLLFGGLVIYVSYKDVVPFFTGDEISKLDSLWRRDMSNLIRDKKIPDQWKEIKTIDYTPLSPKADDFLKQVKAPIALKDEGNYKLEVFMDDWSYKGESGVMIQYHLVNLQSGDTEWELGRTIAINSSSEPEVKKAQPSGEKDQ